MRWVSGLCTLGACLLFTLGAQATASAETHRPADPTPTVEYDDYRLILLGADLAAISMVVGAGFTGDQDTAISLVAVGTGAYVLGGPVIHLGFGQPWRALGSFGLRVGLPLSGLFVGGLLALGCPPGDIVCADYASGVTAINALGGVLAAMIIDDAFLGKAPKPVPETEGDGFSFGVAPLFERGRKGAGLSFVGAF
jgi:hypothetical protein